MGSAVRGPRTVREHQTTFKAANWIATRRSLERHLERDHNIRILSTANICCKCNSANAVRPTGHSCSFPTPQGIRTAGPAVFAFRCGECQQTFPTNRGLHNHQQWHLEQTRRAREMVGRRLAATPAQQIDDPPEVPDDGGWCLYPCPRSLHELRQ
jgi:hypothetical protein